MTKQEALEKSVRAIMSRHGQVGDWRGYANYTDIAENTLVILEALDVIKFGSDDLRDDPPPQSR
jgi:hypothetical protein